MNWWVLKKRVHSSWLIAFFCYGVVIGIVAVRHLPVGLIGSVSWLCVGGALAIFGFWRHKLYALTFLFIAGVIVGLWRGGFGLAQLSPYESLIGYSVTVVGSVSEDPDLDKNGQLVLQLNNLKIDGHKLDGSVWISAGKQSGIKRSDIVTVKGKLGSGFGNISASMYRATIIKAQRPMPGDVAGRARDWFATNVRKAVPEPEASLGIGYLVGQRSALPTELDTALKTVGLTHVVVASGYNLTILVRLARRLFEKVSKYLSALAGGCMILAFMAVTGLSPSMSRAGLVAGLSLTAWYYGRKFHPLVLLPLAAAVTLLVNPSYGWNDLGWELSFAAFAGVMIIAPIAQSYFFGDKKPGLVRQIIGETVSAELATLPILVLAFGQFSNVGLVGNLLVLPLVPMAMFLTFVAGLGSLFLPSFALFIGLPASWLLGYMINVAQYLAALPWVQTKLTVNVLAVIIYYGLFAFLCLYMWYKTKFNLRDANIVE